MSGQEQKPRPSGRGVVTEPTNGGIVPATTTAAPQTIQEVPRGPTVARPPIAAGASPRGIVPTTFDEVKRIAAMAVEAGLAGKEDDKSVAVAQAGMRIMKGLELGMTPTMALDCIAIINGRTCVWGKAIPALIRGRSHKIEEWETGTRMADDWTFHCKITRGDTGEVTSHSFSVLDAKQARLWSPDAKVKRFKKGGGESFMVDNDSPWHRFPQRMLLHRARGYSAADGAPEALLGMYTAEEMQDLERAEREIQEEERGQIGVAPPPPLLNPEPEPAQSADGSVASVEISEQGAKSEGAGNQPDTKTESKALLAEAATRATSLPGDLSAAETASEEAPIDEELEVAAAACRAAMATAKTMERVDQLKDAFDKKFDGRISGQVESELEAAYEDAELRILDRGK